jgi:CMP-N,N'-diacetyllegionaminic acid synthase
MIDNFRILAVIPARLGSKGLKQKNIKKLNGIPLIAYSIKSLKRSKFVDKIFVSTESVKIKKIVEGYGLSVDFFRPKKLALDHSRTFDVIKHVIIEMEKLGHLFDYIALIEPTSPIRKRKDIDNAIKLLHKNRNRFDSLVSVGEISELPNLLKKIVKKDNRVVRAFPNLKQISRRQDSENYFFPYGVIYLSKTKTLLKEKTFYCKNTLAMKIDKFQCYEIDHKNDLISVEAILKAYNRYL